MTRLIDADELKEKFADMREGYPIFSNTEMVSTKDIADIIDNAPTVETETLKTAHTKIGYERGFDDGYAKCVEDNERPQGEWKYTGMGIYECTNCGAGYEAGIYEHCNVNNSEFNFCPNCGAQMVGGKEEWK